MSARDLAEAEVLEAAKIWALARMQVRASMQLGSLDIESQMRWLDLAGRKLATAVEDWQRERK